MSSEHCSSKQPEDGFDADVVARVCLVRQVALLRYLVHARGLEKCEHLKAVCVVEYMVDCAAEPRAVVREPGHGFIATL